MTDSRDVEFWKTFENLELVIASDDGQFLKLCGWDDDVVFECVYQDLFGAEEILKIARKVEIREYIWGKRRNVVKNLGKGEAEK